MPSSLLFDNVELAWIAYDELEDCILIHHNQLNGNFAWCLNNNQKLWLLRFIIRTFVQRLPKNKRSYLFVPESSTYIKFLSRKNGHDDIAIYPYTKEVMQKSDFRKVTFSEFKSISPIAASKSDITNYLNEDEIFFWRFEYDNITALANQCAN